MLHFCIVDIAWRHLWSLGSLIKESAVLRLMITYITAMKTVRRFDKSQFVSLANMSYFLGPILNIIISMRLTVFIAVIYLGH